VGVATALDNTLCRVQWRKDSGFRLVARKDVRRLTGLEPTEILDRPDTQTLTRIDRRGVRQELLRIPVELMIDQAEG
jgi:hypothetical protein